MVSANIRDKFKKLYKKKFNLDLTDEEATKMANDLINLVEVLVKPEPKPIAIPKLKSKRRVNEAISLPAYQ